MFSPISLTRYIVKKSVTNSKHARKGLFRTRRNIRTTLQYRTLSNENWRDDPSVIHSDIPPLDLPNLDMCTAYFPRWEQYGDSIALECTTTGQKVSFTDLIDLSLRWSAQLEKLNNINGISKCKVALLAPNIMEYIPILFGTLANGSIFTTINNNYKAGEIAYQLKDAKPEVLLVDAEYENVADQAVAEAKIDVKVITVGPSSRGKPNVKDIIYDRNSPKDKSFKQVRPNDDATILYSSGTTGRPKGVVTSHSSITNNVLSLTHPNFHPILNPRDETVLGTMPAYHAFGLFIIMLCNLYHGTKVAIIRTFDSNSYGETIKKYQVRTLHMVPTLMNFVINSPLVRPEHMTFVHSTLVGGAPVATSAADAFKEKAPNEINFIEGYGMTESLITHCSPHDSLKLGYCGKLVPNVWAKIVDPETGEAVERGKRGELLLRSSGRMSYYLNNPKATEETIDSEGWIRSGDVAVCSEDGYFSIVDRLKELIKVKGFQVSPAEVEDVLLGHPAVAEAGVVGIPDEAVGERVRAYVTVKTKVDEQELIEYVAEKLSRHKQLTGGVRFIEDMPKNPTGKLLRKELREMARKEGL